MTEKKVEIFKKRPVLEGNGKVDIEAVKVEILEILVSILKLVLRRPDLSKVFIIQGERTTIYEIDVSQEDFGRLVGAKGKNINSIRTVVQAISLSNSFRAIVQIKDEDRFF